MIAGRAQQACGYVEDSGTRPGNFGRRWPDAAFPPRGACTGRPPVAKVGDVMSQEVKYCYADDDVGDILDNMAEQQLRRMPVVDRNKRLVGIVSITDLAANGEAAHSGEVLCEIARPSGLHSQAI